MSGPAEDSRADIEAASKRQMPDSSSLGVRDGCRCPQRLADMTWPMIQAIVEHGETLCILPVGATEQHGRHLPTGTDTISAEALCHAASARTGVPVLPTVSVGSSDAHTNAWPGTSRWVPAY
jgi:hypothetical protein